MKSKNSACGHFTNLSEKEGVKLVSCFYCEGKNMAQMQKKNSYAVDGCVEVHGDLFTKPQQ